MNLTETGFPPKRWITRHFLPASPPRYYKHLRDESTIAYHEAGHVVVGMLYQMPQTAVWIKPGDGSASGMVETYRPKVDQNAPKPPDEILKKVCLEIASWYYAGRQAEFILHGINLDGPYYPYDRDCVNARKAISIGYARAFPAYYAQCCARTILLDMWHLVELIAERLLKDKHLSMNEILECVKESYPQILNEQERKILL